MSQFAGWAADKFPSIKQVLAQAAAGDSTSDVCMVGSDGAQMSELQEKQKQIAVESFAVDLSQDMRIYERLREGHADKRARWEADKVSHEKKKHKVDWAAATDYCSKFAKICQIKAAKDSFRCSRIYFLVSLVPCPPRSLWLCFFCEGNL